ncbi:MAG: hypothetical protein EZS28_032069, partial [Streblomastix strix]
MKYDAVLPFVKSLLNQTVHTPEEGYQIQQINSAKLLIEQYYNTKIANMDPTGRRATKYELEALDDRIQSTLGLEVNKKGAIERAGDADLEFEAEICKLAVDGQRAAATVITNQATGDFESATQWMLTSHHHDRIIAGKTQQKRVQALVPDILKAFQVQTWEFPKSLVKNRRINSRNKQKLPNQSNNLKNHKPQRLNRFNNPKVPFNKLQQPHKLSNIDNQLFRYYHYHSLSAINLPHYQVTSNHIIITQITFANGAEVEEALSKEIDKACSPSILITSVV